MIGLSFERVDGKPKSSFSGGEWVRLVIRAKTHTFLEKPILGFLFKDRLGQSLFGENTVPITSENPIEVQAGQIFKAEFEFRLPMLPNGEYTVMAAVANGELVDHVQHHWLHDAIIVTVSSSKVRWGLVGVQFQNLSMELVNET